MNIDVVLTTLKILIEKSILNEAAYRLVNRYPVVEFFYASKIGAFSNLPHVVE